ncbi:hypothetical protein OQA88_10628 [Cercophora sp. LCS_1]
MRQLSFIAVAIAACVFVRVASQPSAKTEPQHTLIYTTTITRTAPYLVLSTVTVTLLKALEGPNYPTYGVPVTGTAIIGDQTSQLTWTLSGNVPLGRDTTYPPLPPGATTTLTRSYKTSESRSSTYRNIVFGSGRYDFFTTMAFTFVEGVGPAYPATIIRTGYTSRTVTQIGGNEAIGFSHTQSAEGSYWRTTTMMLAQT